MNKRQLVSQVASLTGSTQVAAERNVNAVIEALSNTLGSGEGVRLEGFVTMTPGFRAPRTGRNPHTGEAMHLEPKPYVRVKLHRPMVDWMRVSECAS